jgi:osmoprotectant transport system permease protein
MMLDNLHTQLLRLPTLLGYHVELTLVALAVGILISIPLAIVAWRIKSLQGPLLGTAGVIQTVPSLALLALMVPLLGMIGFLPAIIALCLYSILPILRNTVTGLAGVDPAIIEAARGMGMTQNQMLTRVQLPLAAPVIIAGIRTSTVWVVGIATLSTPVGQPSLGNYIFQGLQTQNHAATLTGVIAAALLAIVLDLLIRGIELAVTRRSRTLGSVSAAGLLAVMALAALPFISFAASSSAPVVRVGAKTFTEQYILSEAMAQRLQDAGLIARKSSGMGSTILFNALAQNNVDCYIDYTGTIWANIMKRTDSPGRQKVLDEMTASLKKNYGVVCLGPVGFENAYAFAMRRDRAAELNIKTIADLAAVAPSLSIGSDYEFFARPEWTSVRDAYHLQFKAQLSMDSSFMYKALQMGQVDAITAFSTDGRIAADNLLLLTDPRQALPPYDAVLLLSPNAAKNAKIVDALKPLIRSIDNDAMRQANKSVDLDGQPIPAVAHQLLQHAMVHRHNP